MSSKTFVNRNVILTGFTSFFTDVSSEMIYPLLQAFVSAVLSSRAALVGPVLGIIEGVSESTASLLKVFSGYYSDRIRKRKLPAISGYSLSAAAKTLLFFASAGWYFVLLARFFDRIGKGIRSAPRDALISESTPAEMQGRAFGLQRAMELHYNGGEAITKDDMREIARPWQPWSSVATWYLWRSLDPVPVEY